MNKYEFMESTLRDIANNYDHDEDAHRYGTSCRVCSAEKALNYPEDNVPDQDLDLLTKDKLLEEIRNLRSAIRKHRDTEGNDLCWENSIELYQILPEKIIP